MVIKNKISYEKLVGALHYDPKNGLFFRKDKNGNKTNRIAGSKNQKGYVQIMINGRMYLASRLAWLYMKGYMPENEVDHIDRNKSNNKWDNLRHVTSRCNSRNRPVRKDSKSGVPGVSWDNTKNRWIANITSDSGRYYLGRFKNLTDAVMKRWEAEKKYDFPNCNTCSPALLYLNEVL